MSCAPYAAWTLLESANCLRGAFIRFPILPDSPHEPEKAAMFKLKAFISAIFSLALVVVTPAYAGGNLVAVLEAEIATLDPHFTPAYISRTFGFMVFDTLFEKDA
jgi:hypothetical protein